MKLIVIFVITLFVIISVFMFLIKITTEPMELSCSTPLEYRGILYSPKHQIYEKKLGETLYDISFNSTIYNCNKFCLNKVYFKCHPDLTDEKSLYDSTTNMFLVKIYRDHINKHTVFAFSGSLFITSWYYNVNILLTQPTQLNGWKDGVKCHSGFYSLYMKVRDGLWDWWNTFGKNNTDILFITGHSLGGALSTLCAFDFGEKNVIHYAFGTPKVGNDEFVQTFDSRVPRSVTINNTMDWITHSPALESYKSPLKSLLFTKKLSTKRKIHLDSYKYHLPEIVFS